MIQRRPLCTHAWWAVCGLLIAAGCGKEGRAAERAIGGVEISRATSSSGIVAGCDSAPGVFCFSDTARAEMQPGDPVPRADRDWIWFGTGGDSIEVRGPDGSSISTNVGTEHDSDRNNVSYFHGRLTGDGVVAITITFWNAPDVVPYELSVRSQRTDARARLRPTGKWARLTIVGANPRDSLTIAPLSVARFARSEARWRVTAQSYNVALVADSLYEVCKVPCASPDTISLVPNGRETQKLKGRP
jgi:hypothetical protein